MTKVTLAALGGLILLAGTAFAAPAPNAFGSTGMGGGVYYNPAVRGQVVQPLHQDRTHEVGTTEEGGWDYR